MELDEEGLHRIALRLVPGVGDVVYKNLIANCGSATEVFRQRKSLLMHIPGVGKAAADSIKSQSVMARAEEEVLFIEDNGLSVWFYLDEGYPERLKWCEDGPVLLYHKGEIKMKGRPLLAMVGTRNATAYGVDFCKNFIADLKPFDPVIVSGLAYGIDIHCHRAAMDHDLTSIAVLGHGLDRVYPFVHRSDALRMMQNGGLLTEFMSGSQPDRENFPKRNRIVAGMCDAVIVVEAARKGGALITAEIASSYNREVFAVPGRLGDPFSEGCNYLIKSHKASIITGVSDLEYVLNWQRVADVAVKQQVLPLDLTPDESGVLEVLREKPAPVEISLLVLALDKPVHIILQLLMSLELKGLVNSLPGKCFSLR